VIFHISCVIKNKSKYNNLEISKIKDCAKARKITITNLCLKTGIPLATFNSLKKHTLTVEKLEKMSSALGVQMDYWWKDNNIDNVSDTEVRYKKEEPEIVKILKDKIRDLKKANRNLQKYNNHLYNENLELNKKLGRKKEPLCG
jgi:hypothetical protein